ncbi:MAG: ATP-dependent RecD-like DNA helicase [Humidesulfovibrio sp.]|uniref:SF1B family DNA helicase RecD2 n=1 Tax=Humidesulfovibrio sp. TaxID=2910988 RepID=UPI002736045B|nr:ATP-dependent RecD-like DNA helicase [Humidesulfovibrio sp.]MDP2848146.1 ATP-dependent RecD-like DNA helicase [Humidesulfovibrio sp.]
MPASIKAEVQSVVYHNPENGYAVARVRAKNEPGIITVVGCLGQLQPGEFLEMEGEWKNHPKFGRQLEVSSFKQTYPATEHGVVRFLKSSLKGVGEKTAEALVKQFGVAVLDILDTDPDRLLKLKVITKKKLEGMVESWRTQREIKSLIVFLHSHEVPPTYASRIFKLYGAQSEEKLRANPYELAYLIRGIGFRTADTMALKLGFAEDAPERVEAALGYVLISQGDRGGHMFCPEEQLFKECSRMLGLDNVTLLEEGLESLERKKRVHIEDLPEQGVTRAVFLMSSYRAEREISQRLFGLVSHPSPVSRSKVQQALPKIEAALGFDLSREQREAVFEACVNKVFIITGGPGTGKTTITRAIVAALTQLKLKVRLAAPTGRAAKRLSEATGEPAQTLHRLLLYSPEHGFYHCEDQKLQAEVLLVDEVSMLDAGLFLALLRALPVTCRLILVGDVNQLPSVGAGNVLADLINSGDVPKAVLTHIFRQAQESSIVVNAHRFNAGKFPVASDKEPPEADFFWIPQDNPIKVQEMILEMVCQRIPERYGLNPLRDVQVLTPMHKGEVGTSALNNLLQERLNPKRGLELKRGYATFRPGDRVLQLRNNYDKDVFNGDLGWVHEVDPEEGSLSVDFDGNLVAFDATELEDLTLAYAVSVHKSQGCEYPAIVVPVVTQHYVLLMRNLLYTALTRARSLAVFIGSEKALTMGLSNITSGQRMTHLQHRIRHIFKGNLLG